jgi:polyribonucleotide nucleotidyltransferase
VAGGIEAAKPFIKQLCDAQSELAKEAAKPVGEFPVFLDYQDDAYAAVEAAVKDQVVGAQHRRQAGARGAAVDEVKASCSTSSAPSSRAARRRSAGRSRR